MTAQSVASARTNDSLLTKNDVAALMGIGLTTLDHHIAAGIAPPSFRLGRRRVFPLSEYRSWVATRLHADMKVA